jgi:hypothetical protein
MESLHELIGELNGRDITEGGLRGAAHEFAERGKNESHGLREFHAGERGKRRHASAGDEDDIE